MQYVQSSNKEPNAFYSPAALFYLKGLSSVERKSGMTEGWVKDRAAFCITFRIKPKRSHSSSFAIFLWWWNNEGCLPRTHRAAQRVWLWLPHRADESPDVRHVSVVLLWVSVWIFHILLFVSFYIWFLFSCLSILSLFSPSCYYTVVVLAPV